VHCIQERRSWSDRATGFNDEHVFHGLYSSCGRDRRG
jgi:hypothetical protein